MSEHIEGENIRDCIDEDCTLCGHPFNPHVLVATMVTPEHGGLIFCPERACLCESTWSLEGTGLPYIPDDETREALRLMVQEPEEATNREH